MTKDKLWNIRVEGGAGLDLNQIGNSGIVYYESSNNGPLSDPGMCFTVKYGDVFALQFAVSNIKNFLRSKSLGVWTEWKEL